MDPLALPEIVVPIPDVALEVERDLVYVERDGRALHADLVRPGEATSAILLIHGEPALEEGGCFWSEDRCVKDTGPIESWSRLLASRGHATVAFNHRSACGFTHPGVVDADLDAILTFLERGDVPLERIGLLAFSGGTPFALALAHRDARVHAVVTMYGPLDLDEPELLQWFPAVEHPSNQRWNPVLAARAPAPHLHIWPENDWLPNGVETYVEHAHAHGFPFTFATHPRGGHGFDFLDDDERTHALIAQVLEFFGGHLGEVPRWAQSSLFESR